MSELDNLPSQEARKNLVDSFLDEMDRKSCEVLQSQSYAQMHVLKPPTKQQSTSPLKVSASFGSSPGKKTSSPQKENSPSPLKKMGSLRKQSRLVDQENQQSPQKSTGPSPKKQARSKMLKMSTSGEEYMLKSFGQATQQKASPLKKQMRLFESPESPEKKEAELSKQPVKMPSLFAVTEPSRTVFGQIAQTNKVTNLLKSRKTCEKK